MNLSQVVNELRDEQQNSMNHSKQLGVVIAALETLTGGVGRTRTAVTAHTPGSATRGNRTIHNNVHAYLAGPTPHKRTLSPAGRKAIAAAQKARWAKVKASKLEVVKGKKAA
jgi:hypothetical protein